MSEAGCLTSRLKTTARARSSVVNGSLRGAKEQRSFKPQAAGSIPAGRTFPLPAAAGIVTDASPGPRDRLRRIAPPDPTRALPGDAPGGWLAIWGTVERERGAACSRKLPVVGALRRLGLVFRTWSAFIRLVPTVGIRPR